MKNYREKAGELLIGGVETHIHCAPDIFPRGINEIEAATQAKEAGMRAMVIKSHVSETASRAAIATYVTGFPVFGGIALNYALGGLNHYAVDAAAKMGAKFVWMPTFNSAQYIKHVKSIPLFAKAIPAGMEGIKVLDRNGKVKPEIDLIFDIIYRDNLVFCTGHISKEETREVVLRAKKGGINKVVVTHVNADFLEYELDEIKYLAEQGALIELNWAFTTCVAQNPHPPKLFKDIVDAVGAEKMFIGTDGGQAVNPPPVEMMKDFISSMLEQGIDENDIRMMLTVNPCKLLEI